MDSQMDPSPTNEIDVDKFCTAILVLLCRQNERSYDDSFLSKLSTFLNNIVHVRLLEICQKCDLFGKIFSKIKPFESDAEHFNSKISNSIYMQIMADLLGNPLVFDKLFMIQPEEDIERFTNDCKEVLKILMENSAASPTAAVERSSKLDYHLIHCFVEILLKLTQHNNGSKFVWEN